MMFANRTGTHYVIDTSTTLETYRPVATFRLNLQPATAETTVVIGGVYGQTYTAFTTYSGLNINDVVTLSGTTTISGLTYKVKGVRPYNYNPLPHYEAVLVLGEA